MKRSSWLCRLALLFLGGTLAMPALQAAEPGHPDKPLLWKIEGGDLKVPSYLFGTIHITPAEISQLHPAAEKAFDSADSVYTEIPLDTKTQLAMTPLLIRKDGKQLSESIGEDLSAQLEAELKQINPQLDSVPFQSFKTWAIGMMLPQLKFQLQGQKALDSVIWERATKAGKKTAALETPESQFAIFDELKEPEQVIVLAETMAQMKEDREAGVDSMAELISAYKTGDEGKVQGELDKSYRRMAEGEHKELGERFMKRVLADRDVTLAAEIDKQLRATPDKIQFFAIGTAHYIGKPSVRGHLTEKGYRITRIQD